MDFKPLAGIMNTCINKYGLWRTVGAFCICALAIGIAGFIWHLPALLVALIN